MNYKEKAKRYDEALKAALVASKDEDRHLKATLERIFPELAESEDERIRKELLEHCINRRDGKQVCVDASDYRRWADWLFRIGKENIPNVKNDEVIRNEIIKFLELPHPQFVGKRHQEEWISWLEKQGEQPKKNDVCNNCDQQGSCVSPCPMKLVEKQGEQEPAWSEEDSPYYDDICEILINLLHSKTADVNKDAIQKDLDWLISIKPQTTWKPSKFQLDGLSDAIIRYEAQGINAIALKELLEQLKKLKE